MMQTRIGASVLTYREDITRDLQSLIRIKSVREAPLPGKPFGEGPYAALEHMLGLARDMGFSVRNVDGYAGHVEYGDGAETIGVLAHLDVVPEGEGWTVPPYGGILRDGILYGRGASDDKGPAVAALHGLRAIRDAVESGSVPPLRRRIRVILGCAEETGSEDMAHYFSREPLPTMGFTPDAGYPVVNREKGLLRFWLHGASGTPGAAVSGRGGRAGGHRAQIRWIRAGEAFNMVPQRCVACLDPSALPADARAQIDQAARTGLLADRETEEGLLLETAGISAHGSVPERGTNAALRMVAVLAGIVDGDPLSSWLRFIRDRIGEETDGTSLGAACEDAVSGRLSLCVGMVACDGGAAQLSLDVRYPVTLSGDDVAQAIRRTVESAGFRLETVSHSVPLYLPEDSLLIRTLQQAQAMYSHEPVEAVAIGGGTYARAMQGRGVGFGGAGSGEHAPDEHVAIEELMCHAQICTQAMYMLAQA